ncbi:transcriptional regulator NanR [Shinella kummerowiae]|jgi:DNA-binding FadR family transcriptional regulator|uniref:Transcriptional regulator NanR n=1 Tax=Shinella kummerowiae TaxID=417745 RepID=A0A6N8SDT6_9HYPH|nr:transcriptional regulator NanR [Shinella kummerowiae]MXN47234.1 transcriptional regulator NanR [Shinella kummerowiae]
MNVVSEPIVRKKLSDEVFARLKHMIETGELKAGDDMPSERELMERYGVGRPAIREAMQALAGKGLVEISQGERAKVLRITAESIFRQVDLPAKMMLSGSSDSLEHLKSARIFFERGMIREAAARATPEHITQLNALLDKQRQSLSDADAFIEADMEFHQYIAQISGNPIFAAVSGAMLGWLKSYHTEMLIWTGRENFTLAEHEEIIRTIENGNADLAEKAMIKHLERSRALYAIKERT